MQFLPSPGFCSTICRPICTAASGDVACKKQQLQGSCTTAILNLECRRARTQASRAAQGSGRSSSAGRSRSISCRRLSRRSPCDPGWQCAVHCPGRGQRHRRRARPPQGRIESIGGTCRPSAETGCPSPKAGPESNPGAASPTAPQPWAKVPSAGASSARKPPPQRAGACPPATAQASLDALGPRCAGYAGRRSQPGVAGLR